MEKPLRFGDLKPAPGSKRPRKRKGRGHGSGNGTTAGRGYKGQKSRSGYKYHAWFEGGQMPLQRRLPKRGFTNTFRVEYAIVNVSVLNRFEPGTRITPELLGERGLVPRKAERVKILGNGEIDRALQVEAHAITGSAREKIEKAGGSATVLTPTSTEQRG